jgi:large subunit ribosomal protein LP0
MRRRLTSSRQKLSELLVGNVGVIFTETDLSSLREAILSYKVPAPARVGSVAPVDVIVPAGGTGMDPSQTNFFQVLNIATKINKGAVEIVADVHLIKAGDKVGSSEAALLSKLKIQPFSYGLKLLHVYDNGSVYDPKVLDINDEVILKSFSAGVATIASISLAANYPTVASVPHSIVNSYKNVLAIALETEYTFPLAQKVKDYLANPGAFAAAAPSGGAAPAAASEKKKEEVKEEEEEEGDYGSACPAASAAAVLTQLSLTRSVTVRLGNVCMCHQTISPSLLAFSPLSMLRVMIEARSGFNQTGRGDESECCASSSRRSRVCSSPCASQRALCVASFCRERTRSASLRPARASASSSASQFCDCCAAETAEESTALVARISASSDAASLAALRSATSKRERSCSSAVSASLARRRSSASSPSARSQCARSLSFSWSSRSSTATACEASSSSFIYPAFPRARRPPRARTRAAADDDSEPTYSYLVYKRKIEYNSVDDWTLRYTRL